MYKNFITKTDLINMYNDNSTNLKNVFVNMQKENMNDSVALQFDYSTGKFNLWRIDTGELAYADIFGPVIFETLCKQTNPDEVFYQNIDCIVDGYNQGLEYYLNELD